MRILEETKNFIENSKVTKSEIWANISINNRKLPNRFIFIQLRKYIKNFLKNQIMEPRMVGIAGMRGVGKTTLLWQIADYVKNNFAKIDVYFLSMDITVDYGFENKHIIEAFKEIINTSKKVVLLFDEVQYMDNWFLLLKIIYDKFKNVFIIATGSSSLLIYSSVDLSTRWSVESLYPLRFTEFIMIKSWLKTEGKKAIFPQTGLGKKIKEVLFYSQTPNEVKDKIKKIEREIQEYFNRIEELYKKEKWENYLNEYIFYHNIPRLLTIDEKNMILNRTFDLLHRVLYQDLREFYQQNEVEKIKRLLNFLAFSDEFSKEKISQDIGIKEQKIDKIINSLINAEILIKFPAYGGTKTRIKREKLFFVSPTIRYAIIKKIYHSTERFHPKLYEDITALYLKRIFNGLILYGGSGVKKSPDFIIEIDNKVIAVEIGTAKTDLSQLDEVKDKQYGLLLNARTNEVQRRGNHIIFPIKWFLLM